MKLHKQATTIKLPLVVRKNIFLICKEAINNAVKYSNASLLNVEFILKEMNYIPLLPIMELVLICQIQIMEMGWKIYKSELAKCQGKFK
jgi:hypothetical protein